MGWNKLTEEEATTLLDIIETKYGSKAAFGRNFGVGDSQLHRWLLERKGITQENYKKLIAIIDDNKLPIDLISQIDDRLIYKLKSLNTKGLSIRMISKLLKLDKGLILNVINKNKKPNVRKEEEANLNYFFNSLEQIEQFNLESLDSYEKQLLNNFCITYEVNSKLISTLCGKPIELEDNKIQEIIEVPTKLRVLFMEQCLNRGLSYKGFSDLTKGKVTEQEIKEGLSAENGNFEADKLAHICIALDLELADLPLGDAKKKLLDLKRIKFESSFKEVVLITQNDLDNDKGFEVTGEKILVTGLGDGTFRACRSTEFMEFEDIVIISNKKADAGTPAFYGYELVKLERFY